MHGMSDGLNNSRFTIHGSRSPSGNASPSQLHIANQGGIGTAVLPNVDPMDDKPASGQFNILGADLQTNAPAENVDIDKKHLAAFPLC